MTKKLSRREFVKIYASERSKFAVCTENGPELLPVEPLLDGSASD